MQEQKNRVRDAIPNAVWRSCYSSLRCASMLPFRACRHIEYHIAICVRDLDSGGVFRPGSPASVNARALNRVESGRCDRGFAQTKQQARGRP
jgi:hypothetical protein